MRASLPPHAPTGSGTVSAFRSAAVWMQACGVLASFALLAFMPPLSGRMILLPLGMHSHGEIMALAIAHGARPVGYGSVAGSLVVDGRRDRLMTAMLAQGIVPLAAPAAGCEPQRAARPGVRS
ncbi:hypothetical protein PX699_14055 [Sphingobium sp. H39-3-25]|uniref:hypothetical protein n=1 Tax=Sphingobium arseniciresistens TaxID=3030834 RepID=UPI0023B8D4DA|nr:hypothetical protein [Sphingobium arseniciresistens]